ncbi:unnamed protein product [Allacma fusca]|uniref:E2F-associated phosphoprotein n=1 Tax=Allacma fusca TaxID=39272 RepID=A0A8J2JK38_9HEXA|nr:unnamed protein product [Allacma fusca]
MDTNYLDFGSDTDSDGDGMDDLRLDSDEEEERDDVRLLKMLFTKSTNPVPKKVRDVDDFEAEMEAELDKRALEIETQGGLPHQKSLSRSSSTSSLNRKSPTPCSSPKPGSSKRVRFAPDLKAITSSQPESSSGISKDVDKMDTGSVQNSSGKSIEECKFTTPKAYDPIYFDSDEEEGEDEEAKKAKKSKRSVLSNDDLFYDPESDSRDQAWIDDHRRTYSDPNSKQKSNTSGINPLPNSDAVLNCPACFTLLCLDCQRHEYYLSQYRAMFVMNCVIAKDVTLKVPLKESKWKGRRRRKHSESNDPESNPGNLSSGDEFNPVRCKVCTTQVAVYDTQECLNVLFHITDTSFIQCRL